MNVGWGCGRLCEGGLRYVGLVGVVLDGCGSSTRFCNWTVSGFLLNLSIGNFWIRAVLLSGSISKTKNTSLAALLVLSDYCSLNSCYCITL